MAALKFSDILDNTGLSFRVRELRKRVKSWGLQVEVQEHDSISSLAAIENYPYVAYKASKSAMIAFTKQVAVENAGHGIRVNVILPGLMDTPMAVDTRARKTGKSRAEVAAMRDARVPLRHKMGTAWDVANAALFLASDEANFITGVDLLVDGGGALNVGH